MKKSTLKSRKIKRGKSLGAVKTLRQTGSMSPGEKFKYS
jgi:hypothetical protein